MGYSPESASEEPGLFSNPLDWVKIKTKTKVKFKTGLKFPSDAHDYNSSYASFCSRRAQVPGRVPGRFGIKTEILDQQ